MVLSWFTRGNKHPLESSQKLSEEVDSKSPLGGGLFGALNKTAQAITGSLRQLVGGASIDESAMDDLEDILIQADVGLDTAVALMDELRAKRHQFKTIDDVTETLYQAMSRRLTLNNKPNALVFKPDAVNIVLVVGVNGAGKTTFVGKYAHQHVQQGTPVIIAAGDTFRAAAEDQLAVWAQRSGATLVQNNSPDPGAVVYDALEQAKATSFNKAPLVLIDTAGRLQNKFNLMEELRKIKQVIDKAAPEGAKLHTLLVLDATTGQNALSQANLFNEAVELDGVVLTKLDGTAKGGIVLAIAQQNKLPVCYVGIGEKIDDLIPFNPDDFAKGLLGIQ